VTFRGRGDFGNPPFPPLLSLPSRPSLPVPSHLFPSLPSLPLPLEVALLKPSWGLGERCKLPQWGMGRPNVASQSLGCQWRSRKNARKVRKSRAFVIAPLSRHCHRRGAQVHGAHQAASHIPGLYLPSRSRYSFTEPERMEG